MNRRKISGLFASLICAVLAAQFSMVLSAAVPVEESVQEERSTQDNSILSTRTVTSSRAATTRSGTSRAATSSRRSLDIPPTIEPGAGGGQTSTGAYAANAPAAGAGTADTATPSLNADTGSGQLGQMFYQMQLLQQEVQALRGQVEQQEYQIKRLQRDQKEQYLDLDKRVVALYNNKPAPAPSATVPAPPPRAASRSGGSVSERQAYESAFDAMRKREFEQSLFGFQQLIENYPNGQYTPNAYYWIGELHLAAQSEPEMARQSFMQVVSLYPDHQKTPDALYKLGVVYHSLGDSQTALRYLNQVQQEYPGTSAAGLAAKYAAELQ